MNKPPNGKTAKSVPATLPASLVKALPTAVMILKHAAEIAKLLTPLRKELEASRKHGAVQMARSFVVLHRMMERLDETLKPLTHDSAENPGLFAEYKKKLLPEVFEVEGVPSIPLAEGFRVSVGYKYYASITKGSKDAAYQWLRENNLPDIIQPTVNASSLSAAAKDLIENKNIDMPEDLFTVAHVPTTSVTKT